MNRLGNYLRAKRDCKGYTLRALENKTGISNAYISQIETGKARHPSPPKLMALAKALDFNKAQFLYNFMMEMAGYPTPQAITRTVEKEVIKNNFIDREIIKPKTLLQNFVTILPCIIIAGMLLGILQHVSYEKIQNFNITTGVPVQVRDSMYMCKEVFF